MIDEAMLCEDVDGRFLDLNGHMPSAAVLDQLAIGDQIMNKGIGAVIPPIGHSVTMEAEHDDGTPTYLQITTGEDGSIEVGMDLASYAQSSTSSTHPGVCSDGGYKLTGTKWDKPFVWYLNSSSVPPGLSVDNVEARLKEAVINITHARNNCGLPDTVNAHQEYRGWTKQHSNISTRNGNIICTDEDEFNVVDFDNLPGTYLAYTCWWNPKGAPKTSTSDVRLDKNRSWFATEAPPTNCHDQWGVEPVATHEFGHVFGLNHISEAEHRNLTMSPKIAPCETIESTLGWGDWRGLNKLYGANASTSDVAHPPASVPFWRYYNAVNLDHFYTTTRADSDLAYLGWGFEGYAGYLFDYGEEATIPIYRYWNVGNGDHFYTTNWAELGGGRAGYGYEGVGGYIFPVNYEGTVPLFRYWSLSAGDHFYTTNWNELGGGRASYTYEGVLGYVYP
jgi:hypothetical protein